MEMNSKSREPITVHEGAIEAVNDCIYLGSKMQADGNSAGTWCQAKNI